MTENDIITSDAEHTAHSFGTTNEFIHCDDSKDTVTAKTSGVLAGLMQDHDDYCKRHAHVADNSPSITFAVPILPRAGYADPSQFMSASAEILALVVQQMTAHGLEILSYSLCNFNISDAPLNKYGFEAVPGFVIDAAKEEHAFKFREGHGNEVVMLGGWVGASRRVHGRVDLAALMGAAQE